MERFRFKTLLTILVALLNFVAFFLFGVANQQFAEYGVLKKNIPPEKTVAANASSGLERLTKLKALLDEGVITQEEFDAKKADILK